MPSTAGKDAQVELHETTGALEVLFTLREEFAQWLEEAQSEERKEELRTSIGTSWRWSRNTSVATRWRQSGW